MITFTEVMQRIEAEYIGLSRENKAKFLALLCFHVSMVARATYPEIRQGDAHSADMLMTFNEFAHRVSSQLCSVLLKEDSLSYPHGVFFAMLANYGKNEQARVYLATALLGAWESYSNSAE